MQVGEFYKILNAYQMNERRRDEKIAYYLSWIVNTQIEGGVMPEEILMPLYPEIKDEVEERKRKQREEDEEYLRKEFGLE